MMDRSQVMDFCSCWTQSDSWAELRTSARALRHNLIPGATSSSLLWGKKKKKKSETVVELYSNHIYSLLHHHTEETLKKQQTVRLIISNMSVGWTFPSPLEDGTLTWFSLIWTAALKGLFRYLRSMFFSSSASLTTAISRGLLGRRTMLPGSSSWLVSLCLVFSGAEEEKSLCSW